MSQENLLRLESAIEQAAEIIMITDRNGNIQYVNPAFERITGYSKDEVIGKKPSILKSGRHDQHFYQDLWSTITAGKIWKGRFINRKKDGSLYEEEASISPLMDSNGEIVSFVSVKRDVTMEVEMEKQLRQTQKMEAIGTLAGGIAHDFNNILSAIIGYTEIVLMQMNGNENFSKPLREVLKAGERAKNLINQILTFSRKTEQEMQPVQLKTILKETLKFMRASLPSTIEIRSQILSDAYVMGDPTQLHQVLMNLFTNAGHAMKEKGGKLEVILKDVEIDHDSFIFDPELEPGKYVCITVSDTGSGIPEEHLDRIFDPFFTTKPKGEGTGLGLSVVHGIIKNHGGIIRVESHEGKGSKFDVFLPVVKGETRGTDNITQKIFHGKETLLVVDDEPAIVNMLHEMLSSLGYNVVAKTNPLDALSVFRTSPEKFHMILTDKTMPSLTGFQLAKKIHEIRKDIPIVLFTGFNDPQDEIMIKEYGISALIMKPVTLRELGATIRMVLDYT
jgi:PAS domain S-box-containing protein